MRDDSIGAMQLDLVHMVGNLLKRRLKASLLISQRSLRVNLRLSILLLLRVWPVDGFMCHTQFWILPHLRMHPLEDVVCCVLIPALTVVLLLMILSVISLLYLLYGVASYSNFVAS